jgi:hypothetical protein
VCKRERKSKLKKVKYNEGDIFVIPIKNGKYAICQVVFVFKGKFKNVLPFCVISIQNNEEFNVQDHNMNAITLDIYGHEKTRVLFTGTQAISDGSWKIIGHTGLGDDKEELKTFSSGCWVYKGDEDLNINFHDADYSKYTTMSVGGFEAIQNELVYNTPPVGYKSETVIENDQNAEQELDIKQEYSEDQFLLDMYQDEYYPDFLVDKIKDLLIDMVRFLKTDEHSIEIVKEKFDLMTMKINALEEEFYDNSSEIETVARDSIGQAVEGILKHFCIDIDVEEAIRKREW